MTSGRTRERLIERLRAQGIRSEKVLARINAVPRHIFVDEALASRAYEDTALPIGHGQTISQPYIVARMTEALLDYITPGEVLEVGSGCGYQTAVLAPCVKRLFSIERINPILWGAKQRIRALDIYNVQFRRGDGWEGWKTHAPYDGILVAAAPPEVPQALLEQLKPGGRLVLPVGQAGAQRLVAIDRLGNRYEQQDLGPVSFVPLVAGP
ncbi:MAG: protein-L-isoaspartate(D-aspartate) O-methyltransferase [Pseudomonadota bacterium]